MIAIARDAAEFFIMRLIMDSRRRVRKGAHKHFAMRDLERCVCAAVSCTSTRRDWCSAWRSAISTVVAGS